MSEIFPEYISVGLVIVCIVGIVLSFAAAKFAGKRVSKR